MATFVSLATCHCPVMSSRRGLVYRDSLSALSMNLRAPGGPRQHPGPHLPGWGPHHRRPCRLHRVGVPRSDAPCDPCRVGVPQSDALARSKPSGSVKHLVLAHLRKLLMLSPAHQRGLRLPV